MEGYNQHSNNNNNNTNNTNNNDDNNNAYISPAIVPLQLQQSQQQQRQQHQQQASLPSLNTLQAQAQQHNLNYNHYSTQLPTAPQTPSTSAPNTPGSNGNGSFQLQPLTNSLRAYAGITNQSLANHAQYQNPYTSNNVMQNSMMNHNQPIAPAPTLVNNNRSLVPIRPHPQGMHTNTNNSLIPYNSSSLLQDNPSPTHVVGSQGRRGVLPSAPGRPGVVIGMNAKNTPMPEKDDDGKFPCPFCVKTYLHSKHLKRHLLRHTGDRPYACCLCNDTFSRSDILKRHFEKCATRRGNPTGATHLTHHQSQAGKIRKNAQARLPIRPSIMAPDPTQSGYGPFGIVPGSPARNSDHSPHNLSRANSIKLENALSGLNGPTPPNGSNRNSFDASTYGAPVATTIPMSMNSAYMTNTTMPSYDPYQRTNGTLQPGEMTSLSNSNMSNSTMSTSGMPSWGSSAQPWATGPSSNYYAQNPQHTFANSYSSNLGQTQVPNQMGQSQLPNQMGNIKPDSFKLDSSSENNNIN